MKKKQNLDEVWVQYLGKKPKEELLVLWYSRNEFSAMMAAAVKDALVQYYGVSEEELQAIPQPGQFWTGWTGARDLLIETITKIGGDISDDDEDETDNPDEITFEYQGTAFKALANNKSMYVDVVGGFHSVIIESPEMEARMKEAVNTQNDETWATLIYHKNEHFNTLWFECKSTFIFFPLIPNLEIYLHQQLGQIFNKMRCIALDLKVAGVEKPADEEQSLSKRIRIQRKINKQHIIRTKMMKKPRTKDLFIETLTKMGCLYEIDEDEDTIIRFAYQGKWFTAHAPNDKSDVYLWEFSWKTAALEDIDEVSRIRKTINEVNWDNCITTVFTVEDETRTIEVHSQAVILFIPQIPDLEDHLVSYLQSFFYTYEKFGLELAKLREAEKDG